MVVVPTEPARRRAERRPRPSRITKDAKNATDQYFLKKKKKKKKKHCVIFAVPCQKARQ
jgi:hypothetical protein